MGFVRLDPGYRSELGPGLAKTLVDFDRNGLTNPDLVVWFAKALGVKTLYLIYIEGVSQPKMYEDKLKQITKGVNFVSFEIPSEIYYEYFETDDEKVEKEIEKTILEMYQEFPIEDHALVYRNGITDWKPEFVSSLQEKLTNTVFLSSNGNEGTKNPFIMNGYLSITNMDMLKKVRDWFPALPTSEIIDDGILEVFHYDFESLYLLQYASSKYLYDKKYEDKKSLINDLPDALKKIDGIKDVYLGAVPMYFDDIGLASGDTNIMHNISMPDSKDSLKIFYKIQPSNTGDLLHMWYVHIDLIEVSDVNISEREWFTIFEIEINSTLENPLKYISFKNMVDPNLEQDAKLLRQDEKDGRFQHKYRLRKSFSFNPSIADFPFDTQTLTVVYKVEETLLPNVRLQPPLIEKADKEFDIDGWKITDVLAGVQNEKNVDRVGTELNTVVRIARYSVVSWDIARQNFLPAARVLIPLIILLFISWYGSFLPMESANYTVELNTIVFLSGTALYFSAERPKGSSVTLIDRYFIGFYAAIGVILLTEFARFLGEQVYNYTHIAWQIMIPVILSNSLFNLFRKFRKLKKG